MLIERDQIHELPPEEVTIICTGSQGEPLAALSRLSTGEFRGVDIYEGDTVILAAGPIPGNEKAITSIVDNLYQIGANVIYGSGSMSGMHVSGHGYQEDLKLMLTLMQPKYFVPIHGEYRMLHHHRLLAEQVGVEKGNTFILRNGDVIDIQNGEARFTRSIQVEQTYVDGGDVGDLEFVLRDRKQLSEDGMLMLILPISKRDAKLISDPEMISRGFVDKSFSELRKEMTRIAIETLKELESENRLSRNAMKKTIKKRIREYIYQQTKKEPMIVPILIEI